MRPVTAMLLKSFMHGSGFRGWESRFKVTGVRLRGLPSTFCASGLRLLVKRVYSRKGLVSYAVWETTSSPPRDHQGAAQMLSSMSGASQEDLGFRSTSPPSTSGFRTTANMLSLKHWRVSGPWRYAAQFMLVVGSKGTAKILSPKYCCQSRFSRQKK